MGKSRKKVQIIVLLVLIALGAYAIVTQVFGSDGKPKVGSTAPDFDLLGLDGKAHTLKEYEGKAMVINFWGTWCKPCVKEMPALQSQWEKWKDKGVVILGINAGEDEMAVSNFAKQVNVNFPIVLDTEKSAVSSYGISPLPTTFFVFPNGKVKDIHTGQLDLATLDKQIEDW